jgi:hypothetical protein
MPTLQQLRKRYHEALCERALGLRPKEKIPNIADNGQQSSIEIAQGLAERICSGLQVVNHSPQTLGKVFAELTCNFLQDAFECLRHLRPGAWSFDTAVGSGGISRFAQYAHLADIQKLVDDRRDLRASLGGDYLVVPDVVVYRAPMSDVEINRSGAGLKRDDKVVRRSPLRLGNVADSPPILLASISMKWTMRSDRAQNTRTEALNLLRNRKGGTPQIVVVTIEPMPSRIASIAMGTGDIDCTYHAALDELIESVRSCGRTDQLEVLQTLIEGRRLRDISDLPLDLVA